MNRVNRRAGARAPRPRLRHLPNYFAMQVAAVSGVQTSRPV
jgi:hypothetical protein